MNALLTSVLKFRAPEWKAKGIEIKLQLAGKRASVMASQAQLEQVFLNLLVAAEKWTIESTERNIAVSSSLLAKRVLVEISYPVRLADSQRPDGPDSEHAGPDALGVGVCKSIIQNYGGEFRE